MNGGVPRSFSGVYDVINQSDVLALLKFVRTSTLDPESKDEVRDLLFALDETNARETVGALMLHLETLGITVSAGDNMQNQAEVETPASTEVSVSKATSMTAPVHRAGFAGGRPLPSFGVASGKESAKAAMPSAVSTLDLNATPTTEPVPSAPSASDAKPEPAASTVPEEAIAVPTVEPMERIKEIKKTINDQVGNPAHLIDTTNDIGRAYMNALLTAMKAVSGEGNSEAAMTELEIAFEAVQKSLVAHQTAEPEVSPEEPATTAPNQESVVQDDVVPAPFVATPTPVEPVQPVAAQDTPVAPVVPETPAPPSKFKETTTTVPTSVKPDSVAPAAATKQAGLRSLADAMQTQNEVKEAAVSAAPVAETPKDPLENDLVESGLDQLLKEWSLFKSSGLLGTGAKGAAHPLYKELRNMPMNMVIAGRFEGATPEVRQSITDYMNGWRYEQGMTHDMQETFEHYLRRVVKTIIDKQAK